MKYKEDNLKKQAHLKAKITAQDLFNSYACISDETLLDTIEKSMSRLLSKIQKDFETRKPIHLWVDGSYNPKTKTSGIGIAIITDFNKPINNIANIAFGKNIKAKSSLEAEIYALSIGLSYVLDTYQNVDNIIVHYDCINSTICATNIDAYVAQGTPYTNFKSALKRIKKRKLNIVFEHTKAHNTDPYNEKCDLLAKYYSRAKLQNAQMKQIQKLIKPKSEVNK